MSRGTLIAESMKPGHALKGFSLTVTEIAREVAAGATAGQPPLWTVIEFETTDPPERLAAALADVLDDRPFVWYCNFTDKEDVFIVYPNKVFRYHRGDLVGRREAQDFGRSAGVPLSQLDWTE
jgi:hypothetical protein